MTTSWGGVTLPDPESYERSEEFVGSQYLLASGALGTDAITSRYRYAISWSLITTAEKDNIVTKATTTASAALVMPGQASVNVEPIRGSLRVSPVGVTPAWNASCEVRTT